MSWEVGMNDERLLALAQFLILVAAASYAMLALFLGGSVAVVVALQ